MVLFRRKDNKEKSKEIGRKVSLVVQERKNLKGELKVAKGRERLAEEKEKLAKIKQRIYKTSFLSRVERAGSGFIRGAATQRKRQLAFASSIRKKPFGRRRGGRPKGSVKYIDPQTGQAIGVYEYRRIMRARLRNQRLQAQRDSMLTPEQELILARAEAQKRRAALNPERQIIPDTSGDVPLNNIWKEIDNASNLVP